jgi:Domain of unknown function (DUF5659)
VTTAQDNANEASSRGGNSRADMFETRDFYLACFLRCAGYELRDLRAEGRRKVFVFQDRLIISIVLLRSLGVQGVRQSHSELSGSPAFMIAWGIATQSEGCALR